MSDDLKTLQAGGKKVDGKPEIEPSYPSFKITDAQLGTLMGDGALNIKNDKDEIVCRLTMEKKT